MLIKRFEKISPEVSAFYRNLFLLLLPVTFMSLHYIYSYSGTETDNQCLDEPWTGNGLISYLVGLVISPFFIAGMILPRLEALFESSKYLLPTSLQSDQDISKYYTFKQQAVLLNEQIDQKNAWRIRELLIVLEVMFKEKTIHSHERMSTKKNLQALDISISILKNEFVNSKPKSIVQLNDLFRRIDNVLVNFSRGLSHTIRYEAITNLIVNSSLKLDLPVKSLYLVGNHGVGKTWFVNSLVIACGASVFSCEMKASSWDQHNSFEYNHGENQIDSDRLHPVTRLLHKMVVEKTNIGLLLIDEIDKVFLSENVEVKGAVEKRLLNDLNAEVTTFEDGYLGFKFKMSRILLIFTANKRLSDINPNLAPLQDRMVEINFPDLTTKQKINIILLQATKLFAVAELEPSKLDLSRIKRLAEADTEPGVRQLSFKLATYIMYKKAIRVYKGTIWDPEPARMIQHAWRRSRRNKLQIHDKVLSNIEAMNSDVSFSKHEHLSL